MTKREASRGDRADKRRAPRSRAEVLSLFALAAACCGGPPSDPTHGDRDGSAMDHAVIDSASTDGLVADAPMEASVPTDGTAVDAACGAEPDTDHDGHRSIACGGDDCDDTDADRFPGNTEHCLVATVTGDGGTTLTRSGGPMALDPAHDEDCDPTTFANGVTGDGDHDGDGFIDRACENVDRNGAHNRGSDCADLGPVGAGAGSTATTVQPGDIHPMQPEGCNGVDDNCDGHVDEGDPGGGGACTAGSGVCQPGVNHCVTGAIACVRTVMPQTEVCNGLDDDCDGMTDESPAVASCPAPPANGMATCIAGSCGFACNAPYARCVGSCQMLGACTNNLPGLCSQSGTTACGATGGTVCNLAPLAWPGDQHYLGDDPHLMHDCGDGDRPGHWNVYQGIDSVVPSYAQRGPSIALPAGSYAVGFDLSKTPVGNVNIRLEVTANGGATTIVTSDDASAYYGIGSVQYLRFTLAGNCTQGVEFRVHLLAMTPSGDPRFPSRLDISSTTLQRF